MHKPIRTFFQENLQCDKAVQFALLARIWGTLAGPVTAVLVAYYFSPEIQGYYYAFLGLAAFQIFVELGLGTVSVQFASHEWAKLDLDEDRRIFGDADALDRLASLARITLIWFSLAGAITAMGLVPIGFFVFKQPGATDTWRMEWVAFCITTGLRMPLIALGIILEGCNQIESLYKFGFVRILVERTIFWVAIIAGANLWSLVIGSLCLTALDSHFYLTKYKNFFVPLFEARSFNARLTWKKDLLPFQWRIALSYLSAFFSFSVFPPIIFKFQGAVAAGQFGMTCSLCGLIATAAGAWLSPRIPQFGSYIARKDYANLNRLFLSTSKIVFAVIICSAIGLILVVYFLHYFGIFLAARILEPVPATILILGQALAAATTPFFAYIRAHKREPALFAGVVIGVITGTSAFVFSKYADLTTVILSYTLLQAIFLPLIVCIWRRSKIETSYTER